MEIYSAKESIAVETSLGEWRQKAVSIFLAASAAAFLPGLLVHLSVRSSSLSRPLTMCVEVAYLVLLLCAILYKLDSRIRMWVVLVVGWAIAIVSSAVVVHSPFLRTLPIPLALMALVLIDARAGRIATLLGAVIMLFSPLLLILPGVARILSANGNTASFQEGLAMREGIVLTASLVTLMFLLEHFHRFLIRSLTAENQTAARLANEASQLSAARRKLEDEMLERRRLEHEIARIADDERRRFGQDVHDGVCQQIIGALLRCQALEKRIDRGEALIATDLGALSSLLEEAIDEAHAISRGLCPFGPDPGSLLSALRSLARRTRETAPVQCQFIAEGDVVVPDYAKAQHLYRIAQEALSNAARHSGASQIVVRLEEDDADLVMVVEDNGSGLPSELPDAGMGLSNMAHRAQIMEGKLTVESMPEGGTRVVCRVPRGDASTDDRWHSTEETI